MRSNGTQRRFLGIVLVAFLMAVQTLAHAHDIDHGGLAGKAQCAVCAVVQAGGQAIVDRGADLLPQNSPQAVFGPDRPLIGRSVAAPPRARSPPATP